MVSFIKKNGRVYQYFDFVFSAIKFGLKHHFEGGWSEEILLKLHLWSDFYQIHLHEAMTVWWNCGTVLNWQFIFFSLANSTSFPHLAF